jgi:hypothetical protein
MKTPILVIVSALAGIFANLSAQAELPVEFRLSGQPVYTQIKSSGESFSPTLFHFKAGVEVKDGLLGGVGLQAVAGVPMSDDSKGDLTVSIKDQSAVYLTLSNPDSDPEGLKFTLFLGYSTSELETQLDTFGGITVNTIEGASYGFSIQDKMLANKPLYWSLDCTRFYRDDNLRFDGCGLGATYAF